MVSAKQGARHASRCFGNLHLARRRPALLEMERLERSKANIRSSHSRAKPIAASRSVPKRFELPQITELPREVQRGTGQVQRGSKSRRRRGAAASPNEFQSRLRQATLAAEERARTNNVKLPDKFQLGFDEFARMMPSTAVTVLLGQELSQVQMLINTLLDAKVDSITSFRRHPLPEERGASPAPTASPGQRVATSAKPG